MSESTCRCGSVFRTRVLFNIHKIVDYFHAEMISYTLILDLSNIRYKNLSKSPFMDSLIFSPVYSMVVYNL